MSFLSNVLLTPHNAALTLECRMRMAVEVCETVSFYLKNKEKLNLQNIINIEPSSGNSSRVGFLGGK